MPSGWNGYDEFGNEGKEVVLISEVGERVEVFGFGFGIRFGEFLKGLGHACRRGEVDVSVLVVFEEAYSVGCYRGGHGVVVEVGNMDG